MSLRPLEGTEDHLASVNEQLKTMLAEFKRLLNGKGSKGTVVRPTLEEMNAMDPSEAVCSADMLKLLPEYFDVLEIYGYGGSLLHMLLEGIAGNFVEKNPAQ